MPQSTQRYRVKARDPEHFEKIKQALAGKTAIYLESRKRLTMSTGAIPSATRAEIEAEGAQVSPEIQYDLD
jgi:hypothetical protein